MANVTASRYIRPGDAPSTIPWRSLGCRRWTQTHDGVITCGPSCAFRFHSGFLHINQTTEGGDRLRSVALRREPSFCTQLARPIHITHSEYHMTAVVVWQQHIAFSVHPMMLIAYILYVARSTCRRCHVTYVGERVVVCNQRSVYFVCSNRSSLALISLVPLSLSTTVTVQNI